MRTKNINLARSIFTVFLALVVLIGIAACDKTTTTTTTQAPTTTTTTPATTTADAEEALAGIELTGLGLIYDPLTQRYTTIKDVILPATSKGRAITWSSSNAAVLSAAGVCVRPAYAESDSTVILTATVGTETRDFIIKVLAETVKPISLVLDEAYAALLLSGGISGTVVTADLNLAATVGQDGATVTWASSDPLVIATDGSVYRPIFGTADVSVTLTATISYHLQTRTKTFELYVTARATQPEVTGTIAQALAAGDGKFAHLVGVTVFSKAADGFFVADATGKAFIYTNTPPSAKIIVGNVYDIEAFVDVYYYAYQLGGTVAEPVYFAPSAAEATVVTYDATTIADIMAWAKPSDTNILSTQTFRITAKVFLTEASGNYNTYLVPETFTGSTLDKNNCLMVYYKSNKNVVAAYVGQTITLDIIMYAYRTNDLCWAVEFNGTDADITPKVMTDAETVAAVNSYLAMNYASTYMANGTATFPTSMLGATIAWTFTSDNVNLTTGAITIPATGQVTVNFTATITKGEATANFSKTVKIGIPVLDTIADAVAKGSGANIRTKGVITAIDGNAVFIQDATAGVYVYNVGSVTAFKSMLVIGNEIEIIAVLSPYSGWMETAIPTSCTLISTGNPAPAPYVLTDIVPATVLAHVNTLVSINGLILKAKPASAPNASTSASYTLTDGVNDITLRVNKYVADVVAIGAYLQGLALGSPVNIVAMPVAVSSSKAQFYITALTQVTAGTNADVLNVDKTLLTLAAEALSAGTLTLPSAGTYGSAITWAVKTGTGASIASSVITFPAVTENTVFTLTATLTIGETSVTKDFDVTVRLLTDTEKVAEAKAALTLANPTQFDSVTVAATGLNGTTLVWEIVTADPAVTLAAGKLTFGYTGTNYAASIKVTITSNLVSDTKTFDLTVAAPVVITDLATVNAKTGSAWTVADGNVNLRGVVTYVNGTSGIYIQDADGDGMYCYNINATTAGLVVGDEVIVNGNLTTYNAVREMTGTVLKGELSAGNALFYTTMTPAEVAAILPAFWEYQGQLTKVTGLVVSSYSGNYIYAVWTSVDTTNYTLSFNYKTNYAWFADVYKVGDALPELTFLFQNIYNVTTYNITGVSAAAMTDAQKVAYDLSVLPASLELTAAYTLPTLKYSTSYGDPVISAELTGKLAYAASVFTPTLGDTDLVGTVTVSITSGAVTDTKVINVTLKALTDAEKLAAALAKLPANIAMYSAYTLPTLDYSAAYGTLTISAELTSNLAQAAGVFTPTRPASGSADVVGTITVNASLNAASSSKVINVTVKAYASELYFSEYIEGSSNNKALEIYNGTGASVDLSAYTVKVSTNGATTVTYTLALTGTLPAGEVYVIYNSSANATIIAAGDVSSNVTYYNGDDFIGLYKGEVLVDCIGQLGVDPGTNWLANSVATSEMTLVRIGNARDTDSSNAYDPSVYWKAYAQDTFTYIGSHTEANVLS